MPELYCGNNSLNKNLVKGKVKMGTRYSCLRRGIGVGLNLPCNADYKGKFAPIDKRKVYCGKSKTLPTGYDLFGNLAQCHSKGVGVGMRKKAEKGCRRKSVKKSRARSGGKVLIINFPKVNRKVVHISDSIQLVAINLKPKKEINLDNNKQFIIVQKGSGKLIINNKIRNLLENNIVITSGGTVINSSNKLLKLYIAKMV